MRWQSDSTAVQEAPVGQEKHLKCGHSFLILPKVGNLEYFLVLSGQKVYEYYVMEVLSCMTAVCTDKNIKVEKNLFVHCRGAKLLREQRSSRNHLNQSFLRKH